MIGEYDGAGNLIEEHIWLGDTPIAVLQPASTVSGSTTPNLYYVFADQINAPRVLTDNNGKVVWSWEGEGFGMVQPNEDPDGDGTKVTYNLRFPGQVYDQESGLFYNWHRYYDPTTGRYISSDPIGLKGGVNTYAYVEGDPVSAIDPLGLATSGAGMPSLCQLCHAPPPVTASTIPRPKNMTSREKRYYDRHCKNTDDPCRELKAAVNTAIAQAKAKMNSMLNDNSPTGMGLYLNAYSEPNPAVTGTNTTWVGHADDLDGRRAAIASMISLGQKMGCDMSAEAAASTLYTPGAPR